MFRPIDPLILSQTRTTFSLLVLLPVLVAGHGWKRIRLPARDLAYWDVDRKRFVVEEGQVELMVGNSSAQIQARRVVSIPAHA